MQGLEWFSRRSRLCWVRIGKAMCRLGILLWLIFLLYLDLVLRYTLALRCGRLPIFVIIILTTLIIMVLFFILLLFLLENVLLLFCLSAVLVHVHVLMWRCLSKGRGMSMSMSVGVGGQECGFSERLSERRWR